MRVLQLSFEFEEPKPRTCWRGKFCRWKDQVDGRCPFEPGGCGYDEELIDALPLTQR